MPTSAGGFNGIAGKVIGGLAILGIAAGASAIFAQSGMKADIKGNTDELDHRRPAVAAVPVIQRDIEHIRGDVTEIKGDISKIEQAITKLADRD